MASGHFPLWDQPWTGCSQEARQQGRAHGHTLGIWTAALHRAWAFEDFVLKGSTLLSSRADPARRSRDEEDQLGALESASAGPRRGVRACATFPWVRVWVRRMGLARGHPRPVRLASFLLAARCG